MAAFDPDAYLAAKPFDPDAYLVATQKPGSSRLDMLKKEFVKSLPVQAALAFVEGAGELGSTILAPRDMAQNAIARGMGAPELQTGNRRQDMRAGAASLGADQDSLTYQGLKIVPQVLGTAGVGGALGAGARAAGAPQSVVQALRTGGLSVGGATGAGAQAARVLGGAATGAASAGLVNPEDAATGAIVGGALPVAVQVAGRAGQAVGKALRPSADTQAVVQTAQKYGIPVGLGDISENRGVQAVRSILRDAPISGGMAQTAREGQQEAFNRAVGQTFGENQPKLTLSVLDQAKQRLGGEFDRIWNNNTLVVDPNMLNTVQAVRQQAAKLPSNEGGAVLREIDDLLSRVVPDANGNATIPGDVANKFQSYLRRRAESFPALSQEFGQLRRAIIDSFNASVSPADAAALTLNRTQYKAFKTVEPILRSAELGVAGRTAGDVPAALLPQAVNRSYGSLQNTPLAELSQVGSRFLVDRTPQTGGSARAALQNTAIGAALMGTGGIPALALGVPAAAGMQKLMQSPAAAQMLMGQRQVSPELIQALRAAQLAAPVISAQ